MILKDKEEKSSFNGFKTTDLRQNNANSNSKFSLFLKNSAPEFINFEDFERIFTKFSSKKVHILINFR